MAPTNVIVPGRLRSMPPVLITNAWPTATSTSTPTSGVRVESTPCEKKPSTTTCDTTIKSTTAALMTNVEVGLMMRAPVVARS
jgi:hypothetical protein